MTTGWKLDRADRDALLARFDKAAGRRPVESNQLLRERGWTAWEEAVPITLTGASW